MNCLTCAGGCYSPKHVLPPWDICLYTWWVSVSCSRMFGTWTCVRVHISVWVGGWVGGWLVCWCVYAFAPRLHKKSLQWPDKLCYPSKLKASIEELEICHCVKLHASFSRVTYSMLLLLQLEENKYIWILENSGKMKLLTERGLIVLLSSPHSLFPHLALAALMHAEGMQGE